ncbi:hypothetical protein AJ88_26510 [Mesorhizobium amorphae CCBAU 01583]|nr:hypothetical protein AJ88_26510 [Mesorhizobium amorphae CCBAU 01583]
MAAGCVVAVVTGSTLTGLAAATVTVPPAGTFSVWPILSRPSCMPFACLSAVTLTPVFLAMADSESPCWTV